MVHAGIELTRTDSICPSPEDLLLDYVQKNEVHKIKTLVQEKPDIVNYVYGHPYYKPILQICCSHFRDDVHPAVIETLINLGADLFFTQEEDDRRQLLHFAAESTRPVVLKTVVDRIQQYSYDFINAVDANGNTALHVLIKDGDSSSPDFKTCAEILVESGVDINKGDSKNRSAILIAAKEGYKEVVQYLLAQRNIDIDSHKDNKNRSARYYIDAKKLSEKNLPDSNGLQNNNYNAKDVLFGFLKSNNVLGFTSFKDIRDFINDDDGNSTLLQVACKNGQTEIVQHLLNNDADPNHVTLHDLKTPLEIVSERGFYKIFDLLIHRPDIEVHNSVLCNLLKHVGNEKLGEIDYRQCYELLKDKLNCSNVNCSDVNENTPLHYAIAYAQPEKALELLNLGASLATKNKFGVSPIRDISASLLEEHLDDCMQSNSENSDVRENCVVTFNYRTLVPPSNPIPRTNLDAEKNPLQEIKDLVAETEVASYISESKELRHLLKHPVISSFLFMKWYRIRWFFYTNLAFYLTFSLSLILYILLCYSKNETDSGLNAFLVFILSVTFALLVIREAFQILVSPKTYFLSFENWVELCLIFVTFSILIAGSHSEETRKQLSAVAVLLTTFEFVLLVGQHPKICTNVVMLRTVSYNFFKFLLWFSILILAFAFSFYVLFNHKSNPVPNNGTVDGEQDFFKDPGMSIIKTIVMLTGEFDASSIDFNTFPLTSRLIFLMFVFMIAIILFNLLNGLAVSDTQMIQNDAELVGLMARVDHIRYVESMILGNVLPTSIITLIKNICCCIPFRDDLNLTIPKILTQRVCMFPYFLQNYSLRFYPMKGGQVILENYRKRSIICFECSKIYLDGKTIRRTLGKLQEKKSGENDSLNKELLLCLQNISQKLDLLLNKL